MKQLGLQDMWVEFLRLYVKPLVEQQFVGYFSDVMITLFFFVVVFSTVCEHGMQVIKFLPHCMQGFFLSVIDFSLKKGEIIVLLSTVLSSFLLLTLFSCSINNCGLACT